MQRQSLPKLEIVAVRDLILHEDIEDHRVQGIMRRLQAEGVLKNPPIVGRPAAGRRLLVLDGASRVTAARRLRFPHLLVQTVEYPSPEIDLDRWHHLVVGMTLSDLAVKAAAIEGVDLVPMPWKQAEPALEARRLLACLRSPGRQPVGLRHRGTPAAGLRAIRALTRIYATDPGLHRVREDQVAFPDSWLGDQRVLVLFPRYRQKDIVEFGLQLKDRLPMGITRHTVPNRALRVFFPVSELASKRPLAAKRRILERFLTEKWEGGKIRYYPEPTTLYDE